MGKTLLLADDSVTIQKVVGISFASEDIALVTVDNGDDAIARARAVKPDVILADVVMPGKSGYEVCEAIKADPALRHIPVLLLTGTFEAFDSERANRAGAAGHIAKPFEAQALVERVKRLLASAPAPAPAAAAPAPPKPQAAAAAPKPQPPAPAAAAPRSEAPRPAAARPAAPAPAPPAPQPAAAAARSDEAFDFFDESVAEPAENARTATAQSQLPGGALAFDAGDDNAFAFGDDELGAETPRPARSSAAAHTVAILPEGPDAADDGGEAFAFESGTATDSDEEADLELAPPRPTARPSAPVTPALEESEGFDFEFGGAGEASREDAALPTAAVLDPIAGSDYDVSSSDLRASASGAATRLLTPNEPLARLQEDPVMDLLEGDLDPEEAPLAADSAEDTFDREPVRAAAPPAREPQRSPARPPVPAPAAPRPAAEPPRSAPLRETPARGGAEADAMLARVAPALRAQLHDTLEKIAWEAFGGAAEAIIQQAVERVEKVAWEVVPRLAETLILEEIRKLKGESDEPA